MKTKATSSICLMMMVFAAAAMGYQSNENLHHWEVASPDPDRIFLSFYGDVATSRAVTWRTDTSVTTAVAQIAKSTANPNFVDAAKTIKAQTETIDLNQIALNTQGKVNYHSVILNELEPETLYAYRVGDGQDHWSEWIQFETAAVTEKPFSFVYFGDAQNGILSHWSRVIRMSCQKAPDAAFAIHAGDLINKAHYDMEWAEWFKAGGWIHAQRTGVPVLGNHELVPPAINTNRKRTLSILWRPQFTLPIAEQLPPSLHETVYAFDYQGLRVIVLNSMVDTEAQTEYLEEQLKRPGAKWKAVTCHYPVFSPRSERDFPYARKAWKPLLDKYHVDLVLHGHDHTYVRGRVPVRTEDGTYGDSFETMYITSVSGQKMHNPSQVASERFAQEGYRPDEAAWEKQFFQVISIDGNQLTYQAYTADGKLYDEATITKDFETGKKTLK